MQRFTRDDPPAGLVEYRKVGTVRLLFVTEPFEVESHEGVLTISPDTTDEWEDGYWVAYPSDGSRPHPISPRYVRDNYVPA